MVANQVKRTEQDDNDEGLSQQQNLLLTKWIREKWKNGENTKCECCGQSKWLFMGHTVAPLTILAKKGPTIGGTTYPYVLVACQYCANTKFINAIAAKVIERTGDEGAKEEENV